MIKKQQIENWFNIAKDDIFMCVEDFRQCRDIGLENVNRLSIKESYLDLSWVVDFIIESNNVSPSSLDRIIKEILGHLLTINPSLQDNYNKLKNYVNLKNKELGNSFEKYIQKFGWIFLAMKLEEKKNKIRKYLKKKNKTNYKKIKHILISIAGYCVLTMIYLTQQQGLVYDC